ILLMTGCAKEENALPQNQSIDERGGGTIGTSSTLMYGLSDDNVIVKLMSGPPVIEVSSVPLKGIGTGELMLAIDYRQANRKMYGVSDANLIYQIDPVTGVTFAVTGYPFTPAINGGVVGFDINPTDDRIRLVTDNDENLRIHPLSGQVVAIDKNLAPSQASINSIAYVAVVTSGLSTSFGLFDLDMGTGNLFRQNGNTGELQLVGSTGLNILSEGGFDSSKGLSWAVFLGGARIGSPGATGDNTSTAYRLWNINVKTAAVRSMGTTRPLIGLAVP